MFLWIEGQFNFTDLIFAPLYIGIIFFISNYFKPKNSQLRPYFFKGLILKIFGGILFWFVHCMLYKGGDSWAYFYSSKALGELFLFDFNSAWNIITEKINGVEALTFFNSNTGYPAVYMIKGSHTFSVARYSSLFYLIGAKSFLISTILISSFSFIGFWKFYKMLIQLYPGNEKAFFYLILAVPSLLFWGGGIMKDTYVVSSTCWLTYNFYQIFIRRKNVFINLLILIFNVYIIVTIKSYVIISLFPGILIWLNNTHLKKVNNKIIRAFVFPFLIAFISLVGFFTFQNLSSVMGNYSSVNSTIQQAKIIQEDLLREEQYGNNNYYVGEIDESFQGLLKLAPVAIFTAIFRPLPWEVGSPMMIFSAIENSVLIIFFLLTVFRINPLKSFRIILSEPYIMFAFAFSLFFAVGVGLASTNFGALVRYKIPLIPFFFSATYLLFKIQKNR